MLKTRQLAQNGVTYARPLVTKPRLNNHFGSPRNGILNQSLRNCLVDTSDVIGLMDPCHPLKESDLAPVSPLFASITSCSLLP